MGKTTSPIFTVGRTTCSGLENKGHPWYEKRYGNEIMIKGIGIDLIEVGRLERLIAKDGNFVKRMFSPEEIRYCHAKRYRAQHYAVRFAAKEALLKALGCGLSGGIGWKDISVEKDEAGKPVIRLQGKAEKQLGALRGRSVHLSMSHTREWAVSCVVID